MNNKISIFLKIIFITITCLLTHASEEGPSSKWKKHLEKSKKTAISFTKKAPAKIVYSIDAHKKYKKLRMKGKMRDKPYGELDIFVFDAAINPLAGLSNNVLGLGPYTQDEFLGSLTNFNFVLPFYRNRIISLHDILYLTTEFFYYQFGRKSYDNLNAPIRAMANVAGLKKLFNTRIFDIIGLMENAAWVNKSDPKYNFFVFGAGGETLGHFHSSMDVIAHEYTHAIISYTSKLKYKGQTGALNEHFADVFGEIVQHHFFPDSIPFLIGEDVVSDQVKATKKIKA